MSWMKWIGLPFNEADRTDSAINAGMNEARSAVKGANAGMDNATAQANAGIHGAADTATGWAADAANYGSGLVGDAAHTAAAGMTAAAGAANGRLDPYITAGGDATRQLSDLAGGGFTFSQDDPSYQWRLEQGQKALERSASAAGTATGGAAARSLTRYAQGLASTEYQNAFNRYLADRSGKAQILSDLSGRGFNASSAAGTNDINAAKYGGDMGYNAAQYGSDLGFNAAKYGGALQVDAADKSGGNLINAAKYTGDNQMSLADFLAAGYMGKAGANNAALNQTASTLLKAFTGGFGG